MTSPNPQPACVAAGCPCRCHDGEGDDCDFEGCNFWPVGEPPSPDEEPELAAPSLRVTYDR